MTYFIGILKQWYVQAKHFVLHVAIPNLEQHPNDVFRAAMSGSIFVAFLLLFYTFSEKNAPSLPNGDANKTNQPSPKRLLANSPPRIRIIPRRPNPGSPVLAEICSPFQRYRIYFPGQANTANIRIKDCTSAFLPIFTDRKIFSTQSILFIDEKEQITHKYVTIWPKHNPKEFLRSLTEEPSQYSDLSNDFSVNNLSEIQPSFSLQPILERVTGADKHKFMSFQYPVNAKISSQYGSFRRKTKNTYSRHYGVDYSLRPMTPIYPINAGLVTVNRYHPSMGNVVVIDHGFGISSIYCHLSRIPVERYQYISKSTIIAYSGSSGRATGPHLHLGISINGVRIDPEQFLSITGAKRTSKATPVKHRRLSKKQSLSFSQTQL